MSDINLNEMSPKTDDQSSNLSNGNGADSRMQANINNSNLSYNTNINKNDGMIGKMPANINKEIPKPKVDAKTITALIKHSGEVIGYELSNGEKVTKEDGVNIAKNGGINGVAVGVSKKGEEYLRSLPDDNEANNLSSLPTINE